jgi:hypothetical protein
MNIADIYKTKDGDKPGDMRLWWIPQVGMKEAFTVKVAGPDQALFLYNTLADYDQFQLDNSIKPDYCNTGGLAVFADDGEGPEWMEWELGETGISFDEYLRMTVEERTSAQLDMSITHTSPIRELD